MTLSIILLCVMAEVFSVTGQIFIKHAMNATNLTPLPWAKVVPRFSLGIAALTGWFFLWAGLLQKRELSYIYPFEGLSPVLIVLGASLFLKEKVTPRSVFGILFISVGIALVSTS